MDEMADDTPQPEPRKRITGPEAVVWALVLFAAAFVALGPAAASRAREKARRINCAGNLKGIGLSLRMYTADYDECFPDDLSSLMKLNYHTTMKCYTCPSTNTEPASYTEAFRPERHLDYLYFGKGLTEACQGYGMENTIIACDKPGNHKRFLNVMVANGWTRGFEGDTIEEIADRNGLFLPGYNMPEKRKAKEPTRPE